MTKGHTMVQRMPLNEVLKTFNPEKIVVVKDGGNVTLMGPLGVETVDYPAYNKERRTLFVEQKDCDMGTGKLTMDADASIAILPKHTPHGNVS